MQALQNRNPASASTAQSSLRTISTPSVSTITHTSPQLQPQASSRATFIPSTTSLIPNPIPNLPDVPTHDPEALKTKTFSKKQLEHAQ